MKPVEPIIQFIWSTWEASCQYWKERRQANWSPSLWYLIRWKVRRCLEIFFQRLKIHFMCMLATSYTVWININLCYVFRYWKHISKAGSKWHVWLIPRWEIIEILSSVKILIFVIQIRPQTRTTLTWRNLPLSTVPGSADGDDCDVVGTSRIISATSATRRWTTWTPCQRRAGWCRSPPTSGEQNSKSTAWTPACLHCLARYLVDAWLYLLSLSLSNW